MSWHRGRQYRQVQLRIPVAGYNRAAADVIVHATGVAAADDPADNLTDTALSNDRITSAFTWTLLYDTVDNKTTPRDGYFARLQQRCWPGWRCQLHPNDFDARAFRHISTEFDVIAACAFRPVTFGLGTTTIF
jgi:outer membrane protein assembly factor BamA